MVRKQSHVSTDQGGTPGSVGGTPGSASASQVSNLHMALVAYVHQHNIFGCRSRMCRSAGFEMECNVHVENVQL